MSDLKENWYWVLPAKLMAGGYPGALDVDEARRRLAAIVECGATYFLDLTEEHSLAPYHALLPEIGKAHGADIGYERFAIPDGGVPESPAFTRMILDRIDAIVGQHVPYVHGRQGVGRAGTILGCFLVRRFGRSTASVLELFAKRRAWLAQNGIVCPPLTQEQARYISEWWRHDEIMVRDWRPGD